MEAAGSRVETGDTSAGQTNWVDSIIGHDEGCEAQHPSVHQTRQHTSGSPVQVPIMLKRFER